MSARAARATGLWAMTLLAATVLAGCAGGPAGGSTISSLPPPDVQVPSNLQQNDYRIGPLDTLEISVFQVETLTRTVQVDSSGKIDFPLLGSVLAAGKTPRELGGYMAAELGRRYLQSPQVSVIMRQSVSRKFTVEGAVGRPGIYDIPGSMTLLQAMATAGGVESAGNLRHIVVFRTVDQRRVAAIADLAEIRTGKVGDPEIYPGDIIVVPQSESRRVLQGIIGATPLVTMMRMGF